MRKARVTASSHSEGPHETSGIFGGGELQLSTWISAFGRMSDAHPDMARILRVIERLQDQPFRTHVVIYGEPGTGKEGLAKLLHRLMHPSGAPHVRATLTGCTSEEMLKQFFGPDTYKSGDGAVCSRHEDGLLSKAHGGSLLLDELLAMPLDVQRSLHEHLHEHRPGQETGVTIIGLTDGNLPQAVRAGQFRHDFAYRLMRLVLHVPPLRERPQDISHSTLWICNRILRSFDDERPAELSDPDNRDGSSSAFLVEEETLSLLKRHDWPGNFRELEAVIERAIMLYSNRERLRVEDVESALGDGWPPVHFRRS